jgi:peptidoglycan/LPS O-acetylase OafA/YrhL
MLSGFILMYVHGQDFVVIRREAIAHFAKLRFIRVYPLNTAVLLLVAVLVALDPGFMAWMRVVDNPGDFSAIAFVKTSLLATRWFLPDKGEWNEPVWSLSVEILGYALFPLLACWTGRLKSVWQPVLIAFSSLLGLVVATVLVHKTYENPIGQFAAMRMVSCFVAGVAVCRLWRLTPSLRGSLSAAITVLSSAGVLIAPLLPHGQVLVNFFFAALLYGLAFQNGLVNRVLASRQALFLGKISFPLYLVGVIPLMWLQYHISVAPPQMAQSPSAIRIAIPIAYVMFCFMIATLLHYAVERPAHALGRQWVSGRVSFLPATKTSALVLPKHKQPATRV